MLASNCLESSAQVEHDGRRRDPLSNKHGAVTFRCLSPDAKLGAFFWDSAACCPSAGHVDGAVMRRSSKLQPPWHAPIGRPIAARLLQCWR